MKAKISGGAANASREEAGDSEEQGEDRVGSETVDANVPTQGVTEREALCAKARAVLNANIGACYVKLVFIRVH